MCDLDKHVVSVYKDLQPLHKAEILHHEVKHAVHNGEALNDDSNEEAFTRRGSTGMVDMFARNPEFFDFWVDLIKSGTL